MTEATFLSALRRVLEIERLYANDPHDAGRETVWGIARTRWPHWAGWAIVDAARARDRFPDNLRGLVELDQLVQTFYRMEFWTRLYCDRMPAVVAEKLFEIAVNIGTEIAEELLQVAIESTEPGRQLSIDGVIGPATMAALLMADPTLVREALQACQAGYYLGIMQANPAKRIYRNGWLERAFS